MSVFVDTGLFYALQNQRDVNHDAAQTAFDAVTRGSEYGAVYSSDYVYDEAVTLVQARTGSFSEAKTVGDRILGRSGFPDAVSMLHVTERDFDAAVECFERYRDHGLSFTDATTVALVERHDVDRVLSFDDDFDGVVDRLDPGEV